MTNTYNILELLFFYEITQKKIQKERVYERFFFNVRNFEQNIKVLIKKIKPTKRLKKYKMKKKIHEPTHNCEPRMTFLPLQSSPTCQSLSSLFLARGTPRCTGPKVRLTVCLTEHQKGEKKKNSPIVLITINLLGEKRKEVQGIILDTF